MLCISFSAEKYLSEVHRQLHQIGQGVQTIPTGIHTRDDEQVSNILEVSVR